MVCSGLLHVCAVCHVVLGRACSAPYQTVQGRLHLTVTPAGSTQGLSEIKKNPTSSRAFALTSGSVAGLRGFETGMLGADEEGASRPHLLCDVSLELQQRAAMPA